MALSTLVHINAYDATPISEALTTAITNTVTSTISGAKGARYLVAQANFTYGSGGTTAKYYIQTSLDGGATWIDIMCFAFTTASLRKVQAVVSTVALAASVTATDGTLADNTILSGLFGPIFRVKRLTTGTYAGTTIRIDLSFKG